jgi:hypothetical protein
VTQLKHTNFHQLKDPFPACLGCFSRWAHNTATTPVLQSRLSDASWHLKFSRRWPSPPSQPHSLGYSCHSSDCGLRTHHSEFPQNLSAVFCSLSLSFFPLWSSLCTLPAILRAALSSMVPRLGIMQYHRPVSLGAETSGNTRQKFLYRTDMSTSSEKWLSQYTNNKRWITGGRPVSLAESS